MSLYVCVCVFTWLLYACLYVSVSVNEVNPLTSYLLPLASYHRLVFHQVPPEVLYAGAAANGRHYKKKYLIRVKDFEVLVAYGVFYLMFNPPYPVLAILRFPLTLDHQPRLITNHA